MADIQRHHDAKAAKGLSLKTIKLGGMQPVMRGGRLCESLGMEVNLACKIAESSIATAAVVHLASALPSVNWGVSLSSQYLAADIATPLKVEQGHVAVPTGPGLGITVDEARVKKHQLSL
jgi:muconate cycloisomerase